MSCCYCYLYTHRTIFLLFITLICLTGANRVPHTPQYGTVAFLPRGGGGSLDDANDGNSVIILSTSCDIPQPQLTGVIDLRPKPDPDSIILLQDSMSTDNSMERTIDVVQEALFPTSATADGEDEVISDVVDEAEMDQQAAASHSIGSLCSKVYLIIAYDFANGKTVLHRSFGGAKLMAFVDGVRSRFHNLSELKSQSEADATELILLLVPSSSSSAMAFLSNLPSDVPPEHVLLADTSNPLPDKVVLDLTIPNSDLGDWDASGASYLVDRLAEAFALGGEKFQSINPFVTEIVGVFDTEEEDEKNVDSGTSDNDMSEIIVRHIVCSLRDEHADSEGGDTVIRMSAETETSSAAEEFQDLIRKTYEAAGGVGNINFQ